MLDRREAGHRIQVARQFLNLTQADAATQLGMPRQQLSQIERGERVPAWTTVVDMVMTLGLDPRTVVPEFFKADA